MKTFGVIKACTKALKPQDPDAAPKDAPAPKATKKDDDDMDDLFADDDEDDGAAAKAAAEAAKKAAEGKKKKKVVIAMSLVMLEVKPLDSETNLDDLA